MGDQLNNQHCQSFLCTGYCYSTQLLLLVTLQVDINCLTCLSQTQILRPPFGWFGKVCQALTFWWEDLMSDLVLLLKQGWLDGIGITVTHCITLYTDCIQSINITELLFVDSIQTCFNHWTLIDSSLGIGVILCDCCAWKHCRDFLFETTKT